MWYRTLSIISDFENRADGQERLIESLYKKRHKKKKVLHCAEPSFYARFDEKLLNQALIPSLGYTPTMVCCKASRTSASFSKG